MNESNPSSIKKPLWIYPIALIALLFGLATIKEGGTVLFTVEGRIAAGHFVPFVLWFNFFAGFAYIFAGIALIKLNTCTKRLSALIATSTTIIFILFGIHILNGGEYEARTAVAMTIRSSLWILITIIMYRSKILTPVKGAA